MKATFLAVFLLIACTQAISTSAYNKKNTSQDTGLIQSNGQAQELLDSTSSASQTSTGKFYEIIEGTRMLNDKVEESINEHKHELSSTSRKGQGGSAGVRGSKGAYGGANVNHKPSRFKSYAPSSLSLSWPSFWTSTFFLCVSLDLIILFSLHY